MGILDDAIRQHLELKRQHGAEDDDLERLENEAFGPATRPGDPDFVDPDEQPSAEYDVVEPPSEETPLEPPSEELTTEPPSEELEMEADTADHPAPKQLGPEDEAEPAPASASAEPAAEPPEAPESGIFNADDLEFGDLDLEIEEEEAAEAKVVKDPPSADEPVVDEALITEPASEESPVAEPGTGEEPAPESSQDDEDLLEETPDFLQETEGEDLWFEQGPPRDFDFDDD